MDICKPFCPGLIASNRYRGAAKDVVAVPNK
jgi:hypothetical protein